MKQRLRHLHGRWLTSAPRGQFWTYFSAAIFFNLGFSITFFLFNLYLINCGMTERSLGLIGSLVGIGSLIGTLPAGIIAQRYGLARTLTTAVTAAIICNALRVWIIAPPMQYAAALLTGMAMSCWTVSMGPAVAGFTTEEQRPFAFSLTFASGIGVTGLGGFIAGRLPAWLQALQTGTPISTTQAMRESLLLACAVVILSLPLFMRLKLRTGAPKKKLAHLSNPFLRRFLPAMAVWGLVTGSFPPFANVYFVHHLGVSLQRMGTIFSLSQALQFAAVLVAPLLFRRAGLTFGVMLTQLATALTLGVLAMLHTVGGALVIYCTYMAMQNISEPGIFSLLMDQTPESERNSASSYMFFVSAGVQVIASASIGAGIVRFGYPAMLAVLAILAVIAAVFFQRIAHQPLATSNLKSPALTPQPIRLAELNTSEIQALHNPQC